MEVDTDRITDDERMDEDGDVDFPVGAGEGAGEDGDIVQDSDGDEMMADEIQDDEEYEEAMEEENMEPLSHTVPHIESEPIPAPAISTSGNPPPPVPFTPTDTPPVVTPFPDTASSTGFFNPPAQTTAPGSLTTSKPLESPPAPETEMTPVLPDQPQTQPQQKEADPPLNTATADLDDGSGEEVVGETVATTEEALDVLSSHPHSQSQPQSTSSDMPAHPAPPVPAPQGVASPHSAVGTVNREAPQAGDAGDGGGVATSIHEDEEYYDDEEEEEEDYIIDADSLPPIILHLPKGGARSLFVEYENDAGVLPIWLEARQRELAEAALSTVLEALEKECRKEGMYNQNAGLVITEKQMELRMHQDDVHLQSITFLELVQLHHNCGLPEPVQLYLTWEEPRFYTRFTAIQRELEAADTRRSESVQLDEVAEAATSEQKEQKHEEPLQPVASSSTHVPAIEHVQKTSAGPSPKITPVEHAVGPDEQEYEGEYDEEYAEEDISEYDDDGNAGRNRTEHDHERRKQGRDVKAQYAESVDVDDDKDSKDLEREHPNWADARVKPTDALYYEDPSTIKRYLPYAQEGGHASGSPRARSDEKADDPPPAPAAENDEGEGEEDDDAAGDAEQREDDEQEQAEPVDDEEGGEWDEDAGTVDESSHDNDKEDEQSKATQGDMNEATVPVPVRVSADVAHQLRKEQQERLAELRREGLGEDKKVMATTAVGYGGALPTPAASAAQTEADINEVDAEANQVPLDEVALRRPELDSVQEDTALRSPAESVYTVSQAPAQTPSGLSTPVDTLDGSLTASEAAGARVIAQGVLAGDRASLQKPSVILEVDEDGISELDERVNDFAERGDGPDELAAPVDGVPTAGLVPEIGVDADVDEEFEDEAYEDGEEGSYEDGYAVTEDGVTPSASLEGADDGSGSLKFHPEGHPDADDQGYYTGEDDVGGEDVESDDISERTLEDDKGTPFDTPELTEATPNASAAPTSAGDGEMDTPSMTIFSASTTTADPESAPLSGKRGADDEGSVESKKARMGDESD